MPAGGGFSVLNEESKILKKKQKEEEREKQRQKILEEAASAPKIGNWGDLSDEDEELDQLFKPVEDEDLTDSEAEDGESPRHAAVSSDAPTAGSRSEDTKVSEEDTMVKGKAKGKAKETKPAAGDEDLDAVLAEFGVEIKDEDSSKASKKKKKNKEEKAAEEQVREPEVKAVANGGYAKGKVPEVKKAEAPKEEAPEAETAAPAQTEEELQAAREALKKKAAAAKSSSKKGNPQALAAAEAKKAAEKAAKAKKKDRSSYDR